MSNGKLLTILGLASAIGAGAVTGSQAAPAQPTVVAEGVSTETAASKPIGPGYVLGPGDIVDVGIVGRKDFDTRVRVGENGSVLLPLAGSIQAADHTVIEVAASIRQALIAGGFFADPTLRVDIAAVSSRYVTVLGAVGAPGLIPLDRNYRVSEILARAGGRSAGGADCVLLTRASGGPAEKIFIESLASEGPDHDPMVAPGDKVYVPSADTETYYVSGQVRSPGSFGLSRRITLRKAIAKAGGITDLGSERKVAVVREGSKLVHVHLDDLVEVGDIITVGERLF